jgi:hypothetical protein
MMRHFSQTTSHILPIVIIFGPFSPAAIATTIRPIAEPTSTPTCYVQLSGQSIQNLDQLCGVNRRDTDRSTRNTIDLSIDENGDGVSDQLVAQIHQFGSAMAKARTPQALNELQRQFEQRLPYSDQFRQLQTEQRSLQQQWQNTSSESQRQTIARQIQIVRQQITKDPSYQAVRHATSQVYRKTYP